MPFRDVRTSPAGHLFLQSAFPHTPSVRLVAGHLIFFLPSLFICLAGRWGRGRGSGVPPAEWRKENRVVRLSADGRLAANKVRWREEGMGGGVQCEERECAIWTGGVCVVFLAANGRTYADGTTRSTRISLFFFLAHPTNQFDVVASFWHCRPQNGT